MAVYHNSFDLGKSLVKVQIKCFTSQNTPQSKEGVPGPLSPITLNFVRTMGTW